MIKRDDVARIKSKQKDRQRLCKQGKKGKTRKEKREKTNPEDMYQMGMNLNDQR